jgi:hypothetical protein
MKSAVCAGIRGRALEVSQDARNGLRLWFDTPSSGGHSEESTIALQLGRNHYCDFGSFAGMALQGKP